MKKRMIMRAGLLILTSLVGILAAAAANAAGRSAQRASDREAYLDVPMPPGVHVEATELEGPVFADASGRTLYVWPFRKLRNGITGDPDGRSNCENKVATEEAGMMSPYPAGLIMPDVDTRPTCTQMWPPLLADKAAKPLGNWTIIERKDGGHQWAYDGHPVYTSALDSAPGDVMGGTNRRERGETSVRRYPIGPPSDVPPGIKVATTVTGRFLVDDRGYSLYAFDKDTAAKSACDAACAQVWIPVRAPEFAEAKGEWSLLERAPGVRQWVFRGKPLYTNNADTRPRSVEGSDEPGWHNVATQLAPPPPSDFTVHWTAAGDVLADKDGKTVYVYICGDDAVDQLLCDTPRSTQAYRMALCGAGDPKECLKRFPPVLASKTAKSTSRSWSIIEIDPKSGHLATPGETDALRVWAYRDRPVYTFVGDREPGDYEADGLGEFRGWRDGFIAFWVRDDFYGRND